MRGSPRAATSNGTLKRKLDNLLQFSFLIKNFYSKFFLGVIWFLSY